MLRRLMHAWERSIYADDADQRRRQDFGWGLEELDGFVEGWGGDPGDRLVEVAERLCERSDEFYDVPPIAGTSLDGDTLSFDSPLPARHDELRRGSARLFEAGGAVRRAVVVVPQWNADEGSHVQACRILKRFGITALRYTLPYHEHRRPAAMLRAEPLVSPVLGLTLSSVRLAVLEVRQLVGWLLDRGYDRVGLLGSSLGSCIGFLVLAHDRRIRAAAFNHVAGSFADVVWSGLATRHIRESLDGCVDLATLRRCWLPVSPASFVPRLRDFDGGLLMISGAYDPTFRPEHTRTLIHRLEEQGVPFRWIVLPCGHYTLGRPPFYLIDALLVATFLRRRLG